MIQNISFEQLHLFADAAAVNPNVIKTFLANGLSVFLVKGKPVFSTGRRGLPKNPHYCTILYIWFFDNFLLGDALFAKALPCLETFFIPDFNLLS